jgi:hypothetical protein
MHEDFSRESVFWTFQSSWQEGRREEDSRQTLIEQRNLLQHKIFNDSSTPPCGCASSDRYEQNHSPRQLRMMLAPESQKLIVNERLKLIPSRRAWSSSSLVNKLQDLNWIAQNSGGAPSPAFYPSALGSKVKELTPVPTVGA